MIELSIRDGLGNGKTIVRNKKKNVGDMLLYQLILKFMTNIDIVLKMIIHSSKSFHQLLVLHHFTGDEAHNAKYV